ncbi:N-acetylglucosamine-6-phosphate deacetylase [Alphaproteobacteria bacterium]|nr:N-acetylglucosamine-6-phosphate deacetylase [Alphaproteobacteria bacterium]
MSVRTAYAGADIFDGQETHKNAALIVEGDSVVDIIPQDDVPADCEVARFEGGKIVPGLVDLQVNGGGGVMLNSDPTASAIRTITRAHASRGTTSLLATLITDKPDITKAAVDAAQEAFAKGVPGFIGLHLEGPHLALSRKGAHAGELIRPMTESDLRALEDLAQALPTLLVTVAPESVGSEQVARLAAAGAVVSLGHTDCTYEQAREQVASGARCATHLFNAMSQVKARDPGLVGAVVNLPDLSAGLIADGHHVAPENIQMILRSKRGPGRIFLVSDAMATTGSALTEFTLNGRRILRRQGRLTLEDGTLAGADLDLFSAMQFLQEALDLSPDEALRMASLYPAQVIGREGEVGTLRTGSRADFLWLDETQQIDRIFVNGNQTPKDG